MKNNLKKINRIINEIKETESFKKAVTHVSFCNENNLPPSFSYENLEFLGDSILYFQASNYIYKQFPHFKEGKMSKLRQLMIKENTLATISQEIRLNVYLHLGSGEKKNSGLTKESILADVFESFLAALFLERGMKKTEQFLELTLFSWIKGKETLIWDYKTQLQEYCQSKKNLVIYTLLSKQKEEKKINFIVIAEDKLKSFREIGQGSNIKEAEQKAAEKALKKLGLISALVQQIAS